MRLFSCPSCGQTIYFRNLRCGACGIEVAYDPEAEAFVAADSPCANRAEIGCNWVRDGETDLCRSCAMTAVIPDTFHGQNRALWSEAEHAKRWVLATLGRWGWFTGEDQGPRPVFHLLAEGTQTGDVAVSMGHKAGVVTINVTEADPAESVERREALAERLRTMTGHFRHEIAHFLFERLAPREAFLPGFRALFGDERADYAEALRRHYAEGAPEGGQASHVTSYAAAHPHEDWAETTAHLMHLTDIADSTAAAGLTLAGSQAPRDAYAQPDPEALISHGAALGLALNHVTRSMGLADLYPFVLGPPARKKLAFAHRWLSAGP